MAVKVQFEIGHTSKLRSKKTPHPQSFTHDWEIYVQGVNKADISAFVEKVVFLLHESFPKPRRVVKEPPYAIQESGYAGFLLPVEIFFRNRDEPKRIIYQYDLVLQTTGPPQHHVEVKTHIFEAPSEEFKAKLMRGGGVPVFGANIGASSLTRTLSPSVGSSETPANNDMALVKAKGVPGTISLNVDLGAGKKHKSRNEDPGKSNAFSALFGAPITKGSATTNNMALVPVSKHSPEAKTVALSGKGGFHDGRDKASKDRDKSSSGDKPRDKDKKDRHGRDKDRKSSKSVDGKHERDKEKSKKDKTRDKERDREQSSGNTSSVGGLVMATSTTQVAAGALIKHTASPRPGKPNEMGAPSPKKTAIDPTAGTAAPASRSKERDEHKSGKSESKDKERSSSKKSKKEKKDKDKERDRDREKQRDESKDKRMPKDDRHGQSDSPASGNQQPAQQLQQNQLAGTGKATPTSVGSNSSSSVISNSGKQKEEPTGKHGEKPSEPKVDKGTSNGNAADTKKSHKHKKKDKIKDKERSDRDKDKDKERDKEKPKEREKDKQPPTTSEKVSAAEPPPKTEGTSPATEGGAPDKIAASVNPSGSSKKEKHKKSKEKSFGKDEKRQRDAGDKQPELKHTGKQQQTHPQPQPGQNKVPSNLDLSDVDSAQSAPDLAATNALAAAAAATLQHSDSSNSSFPDLPARATSQQKAAKGCVGPGKESKTAGKEHKGKSKQNDKNSDKNSPKTEKAEKTPDAKLEKSEKSDKEEKKRNRRSSQNSNSGSGGGATGGFIEPPVKPSRKEQNKAQREKSKSPSLRPPRDTNSTGAGVGATNAGSGFLPPPSSSPSNNHTGPVTAASLNNNNNNINTNSNSGHSPAEMTTAGQLQLPTEYLSELQELHHKIMTLQDNEELQQVVEMIAATGCYEITHKTFDFDLCKLDRGTVQRLQEFLATSVS